MLFRFLSTSENFSCIFKLKKPICFIVPEKNPININLQWSTSDSPEHNWDSRNQVVFEAITELDTSKSIRREFEYIAKNFIYPADNKGQAGITNKKGEVDRLPYLEESSQRLQQFLGGIHLAERKPGTYYHFITTVRRFIQTFEWRYNARHHTSIVQSRQSFSLDGKNWFPVPLLSADLYIEGVVHKGEMSLFDKEEIISLTAETSEPFYHELWREAASSSSENLRSAIVMGVAAAESGVKNCISTLVEESKFYLRSVQSPALPKLMGKYFDEVIKTKSKAKIKTPIPKTITQKITPWCDHRNIIVHEGVLPQKLHQMNYSELSRQVREMLLSIRDLLWLIDYHKGQLWAVDHVREESLMGTELEGQGRTNMPPIPANLDNSQGAIVIAQYW